MRGGRGCRGGKKLNEKEDDDGDLTARETEN